MSSRSIKLRRMIQGTTSFALMFISWNILLYVPLSVVVYDYYIVANAARTAPKNENSNMMLIVLIVVLFAGLTSLLIVWILKWVARGILQERKGRIAFSVVSIGALGVIHMLAFRSTTNPGQQVQTVLWGVFLVVWASGLTWLLFSRAQQDET